MQMKVMHPSECKTNLTQANYYTNRAFTSMGSSVYGDDDFIANFFLNGAVRFVYYHDTDS